MRLLSALVLTYCFGCIFLNKLDDEIKYKTMYTSKSRKNILKRNPYTSVLSIKESRYTQNDKTSSVIPGSQHFWRLTNFKRCYRKLLSYPENDILKDLMKNKRFFRNNAQSRKDKQRISLTEHQKDNETHSELWDDWSNWSTCSVSCGSGRQVRWRHCLVANCTKGLKKAQIRTCRLKDCNSNAILHWLGIKQ